MVAFQPFNGFYQVKADPGFFTISNYAEVRVNASTGVFQYFWNPYVQFDIFHKGGNNIDSHGRLDIIYVAPYNALLGGGDAAYVLITQRLVCQTAGDENETYAELNFGECVANVLHTPSLLVLGPRQ